MCKKSGESINHLLLCCNVARVLWAAIFNLFGGRMSHATTGGRVVGELECQFGSHRCIDVWMMVPLCLMW